MKRLFIATKISLQPSYLLLVDQLKKHCQHDKIVWVDQQVTHLTLRFLGKTPDDRIPILTDLLQELSTQTNPFSMELNKLGVFGSRYAPSVIWIGFKEFEPYKNLFYHLEERLLKAGFEKAYGNFVPHITLGRIKTIDQKKRFWEFIESHQHPEAQLISIDKLTLFQSKLTTEGPVYRNLYECQFSNLIR